MSVALWSWRSVEAVEAGLGGWGDEEQWLSSGTTTWGKCEISIEVDYRLQTCRNRPIAEEKVHRSQKKEGRRIVR